MFELVRHLATSEIKIPIQVFLRLEVEHAVLEVVHQVDRAEVALGGERDDLHEPQHEDALLDSSFETSFGRRVISPTDKDLFVFECLRNDVASFGYGVVRKGTVRGTHALPFHRLLMLRFLTTPLDEILDEVRRLPLLDAAAKFKADDLARIHQRFLNRCPDKIQSAAAERRPPTETEIPLYNLFLRVLGLDLSYHNPEVLEQLEVLMPARERIETAMTTTAYSGEIAEYLSRALDMHVPADAVSVYRRTYYDVHSLTPDDVAAYLPLLKPSERKAKSTVMGKGLTLALIERRDVADADMTEVLKAVRAISFNGLFEAAKIKTAQALQIARSFADAGFKAHELLEGLDPVARVTKHADVLKITDVSNPTDIINLKSNTKAENA